MSDTIIKVLKLNEKAIIPKYQTSGSVGMDLHSIENVEILPKQIVLVSTGIAIELKKGFEGQIRPRSGLALKGITVVNSPGTIDYDYRGEIKIILINLSDNNFTINENDRIAQLVISPVVKATMIQVDTLEETFRNKSGFGSTGLKSVHHI